MNIGLLLDLLSAKTYAIDSSGRNIVRDVDGPGNKIPLPCSFIVKNRIRKNLGSVMQYCNIVLLI